MAETDPTVEATEAHERGIVAFAHGKFKEAAEAFSLADKLWPDPSLSYNLARTYEQLHDDPRALRYYREYLQRAPQASDRKAVQAKIDDLVQRVGSDGLSIVRLDADPEGASVSLDDESVGTAPLELQLAPGSHHARFVVDGYEPQDITFEVTAGQPVPDLHPRLQPSKPRATDDSGLPHLAPKDAAHLQSNVSKAPRVTTDTPILRHVGVGAIIAGLASFGGAIAFEATRADAAQQARDQTEQIRFAQAIDRMETRQTWARVLLGTGAALTTLGITLLVVSRDQESTPTEPSTAQTTNKSSADSARVTLHCAPGACGAALRGSF